jgi:hypothetical protein
MQFALTPGRDRIGHAGKLEAQRAEALAGGSVVGLRVCARLFEAVEIEPAPAFKLRRLDQLQDGARAFVDRAERRAPLSRTMVVSM